MNFGAFFHDIELPVLIFEHGVQLRLCYANGQAGLLFGSGIEEAPEICQGKELHQVLQLPQKDTAQLQLHFRSSQEDIVLQSSIGLPGGKRRQVRLCGNALAVGEVLYIKICIYPMADVTVPKDEAVLLLAGMQAAQGEQGPKEAMERLLMTVGVGLPFDRLSLLEEDGAACLHRICEWCARGVESSGASRLHFHRAQMYDVLLGVRLPEQEDGRGYWSEHSAVVACGEGQNLIAMPFAHRNGQRGYLLAEDLHRDKNRPGVDMGILRALADAAAYFVRQGVQETQAKEQIKVLQTLINHCEGMICVHNIESQEILYINRSLTERLGVSADELYARSSSQVLGELIGPSSASLWKAEPDEEYSCSHEIYHPDSERWYLLRRKRIQWMDGRDVQVEHVVDISEQKAHEIALEEIASTDRMTGTHNRLWGCRLIEHLLEQTVSGEHASLVFLDMDRLKHVNDCFGHAAGDEMIRQTVEIIKNCIRKTDAICRWGGDEFLLIIRAGEADTLRIMQGIETCIRADNRKGDRPFPLSFSYGVTEIRTGAGVTHDQLIEEADQKMYCNKIKRAQNPIYP